eukprot:scaffold106373_cov66-Phaeocystis_antarctica.AAC.1
MGRERGVGSGGQVEPGQGCGGRPRGPGTVGPSRQPSGSGWSEIAGIGAVPRAAKGWAADFGPRGPVGRLGPTAT